MIELHSKETVPKEMSPAHKKWCRETMGRLTQQMLIKEDKLHKKKWNAGNLYKKCDLSERQLRRQLSGEYDLGVYAFKTICDEIGCNEAEILEILDPASAYLRFLKLAMDFDDDELDGLYTSMKRHYKTVQRKKWKARDANNKK